MQRNGKGRVSGIAEHSKGRVRRRGRAGWSRAAPVTRTVPPPPPDPRRAHERTRRGRRAPPAGLLDRCEHERVVYAW